MADVVANLFLWQMIWPLLFMSDGTDMRPDVMALIICDWCCCHIVYLFGDWCIVTVEVNLFGRCYGQCWTLQLLQGHLPMAGAIAIGTF